MSCNVLLGLGSNLGNRERTLRLAWARLGDESGIDLLKLSRLHETTAVGGPPGQPDFLNAAGLIRTTLPPEMLLDRLQELERQFGRVRLEHWGPRTLDLDILLYGDQTIHTDRLVVPHPEMLRRDFVLVPAMEIAPDLIRGLRARLRRCG